MSRDNLVISDVATKLIFYSIIHDIQEYRRDFAMIPKMGHISVSESKNKSSTKRK